MLLGNLLGEKDLNVVDYFPRFCCSGYISSYAWFKSTLQLACYEHTEKQDVKYVRIFLQAVTIKMIDFQRLVFVVRDFKSPDEFSFGAEGGQQYLDSVIKSTPDQVLFLLFSIFVLVKLLLAYPKQSFE